MTLSQYKCPHCNGLFQVDTTLSSVQVACPHCRQPVALARDQLFAEPPLPDPPMVESMPTHFVATEPPPIKSPPLRNATAAHRADPPRSYSPADLLPPGAVAGPSDNHTSMPVPPRDAMADDFQAHKLTSKDRAARKFVKNLIVWVGCAIVLVSLLVFFLLKNRP